MTLVVPLSGEAEGLRRLLKDPLKLHLYRNNVIPSKGDVLSLYEEAGAPGYSPKVLNGSLWVIQTSQDGVTTASYPRIVFLVTSDLDVRYYGYYVTDIDGTLLMWAERFEDGPYDMGTLGGSVSVLPRVTLD